jgi:bifunctional oligoribonuclease and PAP phosphatase NrnA
MNNVLSENTLKETSQAIWDCISVAKSVVISAHKSPDGDSIGSSLAMLHLLNIKGIDAKIVHPDVAPDFLLDLPGVEKIVSFEKDADSATKLIENADLIICLDLNAISRFGVEMERVLNGVRAKKIMIDHHLNPTSEFDLQISEPSVASTCELIYQWICDLNFQNEMNIDLASCLYVGCMTDTGSFRFPSVRPETHEMIAFLIRKGMTPFKWHEALFDNNSLDRIRLRGYALSEKLKQMGEGKIGYASLSEEELIRFNYQKGDTEGLVNQILSIRGLQMAVMFIQKDGVVKISFRSKGNLFVNQLANDHFQGGGHAYASGGKSDLSLEETVTKFENVVLSYISQ